MCRKIQSILVSVEIHIQTERLGVGEQLKISSNTTIFTTLLSVRDMKMTTYTPSLLLAKCQLVVGEAARRSVSGSLGPGNFTMVRWLWLSAHAQRSSAHWTVYGVVRAGWLRGAHSCTLLPCNNRKWAAAAKNNLNVWHTERGTTTTVELITATRRYNLQH